MEIVEELPITNISTTTIYLKLRQDGEENNVYEEYVYINEKWEMIGTTAMKIDGLATEEFVNKRIEDFHPTYEYEIPELEGATWFRFAEVSDESKNSSAIFTMDLYGTRISEEPVKLDLTANPTLKAGEKHDLKINLSLYNYILAMNNGGLEVNLGEYSVPLGNLPDFSAASERIYIPELNTELKNRIKDTIPSVDMISICKGNLVITNNNDYEYPCYFDDVTTLVSPGESLTYEILDLNKMGHIDGSIFEIYFEFDTVNTFVELPVGFTPESDVSVTSVTSNVALQSLSLQKYIKTYKDQMLTTSVFAVSCNELNGKIISDVLPISQSYELSGTDASGGTTGSGDPIGGGSGGGDMGGSGGGEVGSGGSGGSLYYGLGAITLEQFEKERYVCGLVNFPATTQFKDLRVKLKIENNLNFKALPELEVVDLKEENQNDLQLLEGTVLEANVSYNFIVKGNLKKFLDNKDNYEKGIEIYFAAEEGVIPEKIEFFKDFDIYKTADEPIEISSSSGGGPFGEEILLSDSMSLKKYISYNISGSGKDVLSKVSGTLILTANGLVNPKINGAEIEYDEETGTYRKYYENVEDSEVKITAEITEDENGGAYFYELYFLVNAEQCEFFKTEPYKSDKNRIVDYYEIKNNDVFDFNLKLQEQVLHTVSKSYELFSVFDKLSKVDKTASDALSIAQNAARDAGYVRNEIVDLKNRKPLEIRKSWMYEPVLENSSNVIELLYDVMGIGQEQWVDNVGEWCDTYLINSASNNLYSYLAQSRLEEKWVDEIGDFQRVAYISISPLILPTDKYPDQPLIGKIFAEIPYTEYYNEDDAPDYWEYDITEDMYTAEEYGGSGGVDEEEVVEILNNNAELVEELDIGTVSSFDENNDNQVPTSKAVSEYVKNNGVNENDVLDIIQDNSEEITTLEVEEATEIAIGTSETFDPTSDEQIPTSKAVAEMIAGASGGLYTNYLKFTIYGSDDIPRRYTISIDTFKPITTVEEFRDYIRNRLIYSDTPTYSVTFIHFMLLTSAYPIYLAFNCAYYGEPTCQVQELNPTDNNTISIVEGTNIIDVLGRIQDFEVLATILN